MTRTLGSGRKPIHPALIDNKKYKKNKEGIEMVKNAIPKTKSADLKMPQELTDGAKKEWRRVVKLYGEIEEQILNDLDTELLKSYCIFVDIRNKLYAEYVKTESIFTESISVTVGKSKDVQRASQIKKSIINPILHELRQIEARITVLSSELCLTPAGRVRMGIMKAKEESDPLDSFYNDLNKKEE